MYEKHTQLKAIRRIAGITALVAVIGFSMIACDLDDGGPTAYSLDGVWQSDGGVNITINGSTGVFTTLPSNGA